MRVPNWDKAVVEEKKLREYLLSPIHPVGRYKARYFATLGFDAENWQTFEQSLRTILDSNSAKATDGEFGTKYIVRGGITGPNGFEARLTTVWIILREEANPRFVTAYPEDSNDT